MQILFEILSLSFLLCYVFRKPIKGQANVSVHWSHWCQNLKSGDGRAALLKDGFHLLPTCIE